ncbi:MAG: hypothetical protein RR406_05350 [Bacilli bacterium]
MGSNVNRKQDLLTKVLKVVALLSVIIIVLELGYLGVMKIISLSKSSYYEVNQGIDFSGDDLILAGSSDFKYSNSVNYTKGLEKGRLAKYDKNDKLIWERVYDEGNNSTFSAVKTLNDGYLVVGSAEFTTYQIDNKIREGIIVKYDKDGKKLWEQRYQALSNTKFLDILVEADGYVVIGQSIYENMELGNHETGGGIIVKYDLTGKKLWEGNYGGNKSGIFNDIVKVNNGYVVVGRDSKDTGIVVFFDEAGKKKWSRNYSYTDTEGFQALAVKDNYLYVVGSKKVWTDTGNEEADSNRVTKNTEALIVKYDMNGKMYFEKAFGGNGYERYQDVLIEGDQLYLVGHTTSLDLDLGKEIVENKMMGLIVKTDLEGNVLNKKLYGGSKDDNLFCLVKKDDKFEAIGMSNSKDSDLARYKRNGRDYYSFNITFDKELNISK